MSEANKNAVRRLFEEVWNKAICKSDQRAFAPNYAHRGASTPDVGRGPESEKKRAPLCRTGFPDMRVRLDDIIAEAQTVVARWSCRGTHKR